ncbi:MAG: hypothetical protein LBH20_10595 [Treponema sp.]|jgi:hypothetical protein|nr:hypothetical protein [Treponema sp.]
MKRFIFVLLAMVASTALITPAAFAQIMGGELKLSGEAKSGIYWEQRQQEGRDPEAEVKLQNKDDAGSGQGRFRLNMDYENEKNFGFKVRVNWENFADTAPQWSYAFGYGNFFENQMTVSVGKLGASPWGTGGPEMWKELESMISGGMRVEWKPEFVPGNLNVGFVLNYFNSDRDQGATDIPVSLLNILKESVIGVSYTHDMFLVRLAFRLDDEMDAQQDNKITGGKGEEEMVYRLEERVLSSYLPGLQVWAIGHLYGITPKGKEIRWLRNWLFAQYAPEDFTAQLRFGYEYIESRSEFYIKPSLYWNLFDKLLSVGASFTYCQDFGDGKMYEGSAYRYLELEPKIQLNFTSSYIAFAYNFRQEYLQPWSTLAAGKDPLKQTQWMNLRFCIYF